MKTSPETSGTRDSRTTRSKWLPLGTLVFAGLVLAADEAPADSDVVELPSDDTGKGNGEKVAKNRPDKSVAKSKPTRKRTLGPPAEPTGETGTDPGDFIPEIEGKDVDGEFFALSDYEGKVMMIDFWGDW